ncbi:serine/threonine-protein kinase M1 [Podospora pseudoanserina]|uniref:Serine/threonine-protein kinase MEC1 n=1 Tax=Podospora pseudoanserina TaxID=2609844 RepID=A0ABR0IQ68_9PEZI|nr:serine/threonine-protein kinase M1 [Podospora pseudoanserina]
MTPDSRGRTARSTQHGFSNNTLPHGAPPPSTLAAQIVENISSTSRKSHLSDASTEELKHLQSLVENYNAKSEDIKTPAEQVEYNHLLVYMIGSVSLKILYWDDPFSTQEKLHEGAIAAFGFLRTTLTETPSVLKCATDGTKYLNMGEEPLWLWIFPRLLKILAHRRARAITGQVEALFDYILELVEDNVGIWDLGLPLMQYFRAILNSILDIFDPNSSTTRTSPLQIELPPSAFLKSVSETPILNCTFPLQGEENAIHFATSLLSIIQRAIIPGPEANISVLYGNHTIWVLDLFQPLSLLVATLPVPSETRVSKIVQMSLELAEAYNELGATDAIFKHKANATLALVCNNVIKNPQQLLTQGDEGVDARRVMCLAFVHLAKAAIAHAPTSSLISCGLFGISKVLTMENAVIGPDTDFSRAVELLAQATVNPAFKGFTAEIQAGNFVDAALKQQVEKLLAKNNPPQASSHPPPKRRKTDSSSVASGVLGDIHRRLCQLLETDPEMDLGDILNHLADAYPQLSEADQCWLIELISRLFCAAENTLTVHKHSTPSTLKFRCLYCSGTSNMTPVSGYDADIKSLALSSFSKLILLQEFVESRRPRIFAMIALRRIARHVPNGEFWDNGKSAPGKWCLQSLSSSVRELRIAAGRALPIFLANFSATEVDNSVIKRNTARTIGLLKSISDQNVISLQETCIMAWGQVGRVVADTELNLVLVKLVEYLGHHNMMVSTVAFNEIMNLAESHDVAIASLFRPFWPSLAFSVVKDLVSRPQTTQLVAELLQISVHNLLKMLQKHALPWLVLGKKREVIQKIAEARGEKDCWQPCVDAENLPSILALLLVQDVPNVESYAMELLQHTSAHLNKSPLVDLLRTGPMMIALELFKYAAAANDDRKPQVRTALVTMANLITGTPKDKKMSRTDVIGRFLQPYALGVATRLVENINDSHNVHPPPQERKLCIRAMEVMIRVCSSYASIARTQISACLVTALAHDELRSAAFSCWASMLTCMEDTDLEVLLEATFYLIRFYYSSCDEETKQFLKSLLQDLLSKNRQIIMEYSIKLPSLGEIDELRDISEEVEGLRPRLTIKETFAVFSQRLAHENPGVVEYALTELVPYLEKHQEYLQTSAISERPDAILTTLTRSILDCSVKYNGWQPCITRSCAEALGLIGCLDSNRLETTREQQHIVVIHNFEDASETTDFVAFVLENVLVKAFQSTTDTKFQGYLSYAMQVLLERTDFKVAFQMAGEGESEPVYRRWLAFAESTRETLIPLLSSSFLLAPLPKQSTEYPIFKPGKKSYSAWLKAIVFDLLRCTQNAFSEMIFEPLCRLIKVKDLTVTEFLLPFVVMHVILGQPDSSVFSPKIKAELLAILKYHPPNTASYVEKEQTKLYYQAVFRIIDYFKRWLQIRKLKATTPRAQKQVAWVEDLLDSLDPKLLSQRAVDCGEYARALYFLEPHLENLDKKKPQEVREVDEDYRLRDTLQNIYTQIDDPDGLEGVSAHLGTVTLDQQALNHRKAGRWTAAQTWYEIRLAESPEDTDIQVDLLTCLKESGQHDVLLNYVEGMKRSPATVNRIAPFAVEASWATGRWETLEKYLGLYNAGDVSEVFDLGVGQALLSLKKRDMGGFKEHIQILRDKVAGSMTYSATSSLRACHEAMLRCHVLSDLEMIASNKALEGDNQAVLATLDRRLQVLGAYVGDKQYLLGVRRAAMELMRPKYGNEDISALWLLSGKLARKAGSMHQSFNAVLHAQQLGDASAIIENARLLYKDGHHRKAIQILEMAIKENSFVDKAVGPVPPSSARSQESHRNMLTATAQLLLAKWLDSTGQTHAGALRAQYQQAAKTHSRWEKGHYYLGRHYKKLLESEKGLDPEQQSDEYITGETAKLVIENYLRSLNFGSKYISQTFPRILTLFLELGSQVNKTPDGKVTFSRELYQRRRDILTELCAKFHKQLETMPAYICYTSLPQITARIGHPSPDVFKVLEDMIVRVVNAYPRQALWNVFPFMANPSRQPNDRQRRAIKILNTIKTSSPDIKAFLRAGEKLAEQLLVACNNGHFQSNRTTTASITRDLFFNHKCTPCPLVVPVETSLTATLPTLTDNVRRHKPFSRDAVTIEAFLDHVLVLGSLAKPRKLTARGSDGKLYGLLIKPKDDLRTDQRLMEFNSLINRSLKRDVESSRRQLYIRTYAVTPLNEECGIIEWVDGLKTLREILLSIYRGRNISPNYTQLAQLMKQACAGDNNTHIYTETIIGMFPPVLGEWFVSQFPNPSSWFAARLKYTRSCAVMSMVGTILGLGDRHGENVLLEEGNGGVFHVDFNCLFDKGRTFTQPECVPFRLTHNMQYAMGVYRYEGPFRHCSELTLRILRQQEETLMSILEAFIYDPTLDLQRGSKRTKEVIKLNPTSVVASIKRKVEGLLPEESIPLGVEGQVDMLIKEATNPRNLAAMYIGWCPFL